MVTMTYDMLTLRYGESARYGYYEATYIRLIADTPLFYGQHAPRFTLRWLRQPLRYAATLLPRRQPLHVAYADTKAGVTRRLLFSAIAMSTPAGYAIDSIV